VTVPVTEPPPLLLPPPSLVLPLLPPPSFVPLLKLVPLPSFVPPLLLLLPPPLPLALALALEESGQDLDEDDHGYRLPAGNWPGFPAVSHSFAHPARSGQGSNYPSCRAARDGVESPAPGYRATNLSCLGGNRLRRTDNLAEACPRGATSSQQSPPTTAP
jgi:hypothetical protein